MKNRLLDISSLLLVILFIISTAFFYGFVPNIEVPTLGIWHIHWGLSKCLANQPPLTWLKCNNSLIPYGTPIFQGHIPIWMTALLIKLLGSSPEMSANIVAIMYLIIAILAFVMLIAKIGLSKRLALLGAFLFLFNPIVYGHSSYASMMLGFFLVPLSIFADILVSYYSLEKKSSPRKEISLLAGKIWLIRFLLAGTDWYTTVICLTGSGVIFFTFHLLGQLKKFKPTKLELKGLTGPLIMWLGTWFFGLLPWYLATPKGGEVLPVMPMDFFRGQGIDLITLFLPTINSVFFDFIGLATKWNPLEFYGDASNSYLNYLGYGFILMLPFAIKKIVDKHPNRHNSFLICLLVAGFAAFILSLGPSLKLNSRCEECALQTTLDVQQYLMPSEKAIIDLPTKYMYKVFPFSIMRAVYRWIVFTKVVLILICLWFITTLLKEKRKLLAGILVFVLLLEFTPDVKSTIHKRVDYYKANQKIRKTLLVDLSKVINSNEKVFFLSGENDYLANWIASELSVQLFNGGGDKNINLAQKYWPNEVQKLRGHVNNKPDENIELISKLINNKITDKVIVPYFSLRWNSYSWPPEKNAIERQKGIFEYLRTIEGLNVIESPLFLTIY